MGSNLICETEDFSFKSRVSQQVDFSFSKSFENWAEKIKSKMRVNKDFKSGQLFCHDP